MEKDDLTTGKTAENRNSIDSEREENVRPVAFGEAAFTRDDDREMNSTNDTNSSTGFNDVDDHIQSNSFAASTRFGDEISDSEASVFSGRDTDMGTKNSSLASSGFGEEFIESEPNRSVADSRRTIVTDDLTDDNDALTDHTTRTVGRTGDDTDEDKNLWEKIKDKADDIGEGIKKAFD